MPKTSQKQAKKLLHRTSPRCLCLCFRFYLISSASELTVRVCVSECMRECVCVFSPFVYLLIVCCKRLSCERVSPALALSLLLSLSLSLLLAESVCVCVSATDFSAEIFRRRLRLRLRHSSESNDRARLSPSRVSLPLVFIAFLSCKTLVKIRFT